MCGSKLIKKIHKIHDPLDLDNKVLDPMGLPSLNGEENGLMQEAEVPSSSVTAPVEAATEVDAGVLAAREDERRRRAAAAGQSSTILTGSLGAANTGQKTLLGA